MGPDANSVVADGHRERLGLQLLDAEDDRPLPRVAKAVRDRVRDGLGDRDLDVRARRSAPAHKRADPMSRFGNAPRAAREADLERALIPGGEIAANPPLFPRAPLAETHRGWVYLLSAAFLRARPVRGT